MGNILTSTCSTRTGLEAVDDTEDEDTLAWDVATNTVVTNMDQSHVDAIKQKINNSEQFRHLNDSIRDMIVRDLALKQKFMKGYFDIPYQHDIGLYLVVCEIPNKLKNEKAMYHTGLVIGDTLIAWTEDSLCVPTKHDETATVSGVLLYKFNDETDLEDVLCTIAEKILEWNVCKWYSRTTKNCQNFIDDICDAIDNEGAQGLINDMYITRIRTTGGCNPLFIVTNELAKTLNIRQGRQEFHSHGELDEFVNMIEGCEAIISRQEQLLLVKYDRAFWVQYRKASHEYCEPHQCPYHAMHSSMELPGGSPSSPSFRRK